MHPLTGLLSLPGYRTVIASSLVCYATRWGALAATTLLLTDNGSAAISMQFVGALFFTPLLFARAAATTLRSIGSPRAVVVCTQIILIPVLTLAWLLTALDITSIWFCGFLMLVVGLGNMVNMTSQRLLIAEVVGDKHSPTAMTVEPLLSGLASMIAALGVGVLIDLAGHSAAYGVLTALAAASVILVTRIPQTSRAGMPTARHDEHRERTAGALRSAPPVLALIALTVTMNLCVFSYLPLVPKIAQTFSSSAALAGSLTAAAGLGQLLGGIIIAMRATRRRLTLLFGGSAICIAGLMLFCVTSNVPVALVALLISGVGQSGFSAMQSVLASEHVDPAVRLVILGSVATAIGATPIGMLLIGAYAEWLGASGGVLFSNVLGFALLVAVAAYAARNTRAMRVENA